MLTQFELGENFTRKLYTFLMSLESTLAKHISEVLDLSAGSLYTYLSPHTNLDRITTLTTGGLASRDETLPKAASILVSSLNREKKQPGQVCLMEDMFRRSDEESWKPQEKYITHEQEIYYFFNAGTLDETHAQQILHRLFFFDVSLTVIASMGQGKSTLENGQSVSKKFLTDLVKSINLLLIGCFDGEGYIIWERNA